MTGSPGVAWEAEESVSVRVPAAAAFAYWSDVESWAEDEGVESAEVSGPFRAGARGRTHLAGGGRTDWTVLEVEEGRAATIEIVLDGAALRFAFRFEDAAAGGCRLTQRIQLLGPGASRWVEGVREGFGPPGLEQGMRALARRIERAARPEESA